MTDQAEKDRARACPRCGDAAPGRFCAGCGALRQDSPCTCCGQPLAAGARFCNNCGEAVTAASAPVAGRPRAEAGIRKLVAGAAVIALVAFVAGQAVGRRSPSPTSAIVEQAGSARSTPRPTASDISNLSPEERASRLFNRVRRYTDQGKMDSVRFFAPMAIQAYQMIGAPTAQTRYGIGDIAAAVGEAPLARLEADSILAAQPKHLLGLVLAIRAATIAGDSVAAASFQRRLVAAAPSERARGLAEYTEHGRDIDEALRKAGASP